MMDACPIGTSLDDPVARHMRTDFARLGIDQTAGEALAAVRENPPESRIIYFYVVDEENRLEGVVPTRRLLMAPLDQPLGEIMVREVIAIPGTATVLDACEFFILHRLLAFPVVDEEGRLMGLVDVELYTDELFDLDRREDNEDVFQLIGIHLTDARQTSPSRAFRNRFPWLLANIAGGVLAALLVGLFQAELQRAVALALFIPVVLALAESVSIQSVSLTLQRLRAGQPTLKTFFKRLRSEAVTGFVLGAACGVAVGIVALLWLGEARVVFCLLGGIAGGVTCAALLGMAIPNLLRFIHGEPHVAAGPIALASTDIVTLLIYFTLARWLFA